MSISRLTVLGCALMLALTGPVRAAQPGMALVIGNADYAVRPLRNPVKDARAVAAALKELGYDVVVKENLGQAAMLDAMREFWRRSRDSGARILYYSGHGVQQRGRNFLVPVDAVLRNEEEVTSKTVSVSEFVDKLTGPAVNIVVLDACRTPPWTGSTRTRGGRQVPALERGLAAAVAPNPAPGRVVPEGPKGTLIAFATAPGAIALDGTDDNGVYTRHLLAQLAVPGLPVEQLFKRVRADVLQETGERQTPWETSSIIGDFCFHAGRRGECPAYEAAQR